MLHCNTRNSISVESSNFDNQNSTSTTHTRSTPLARKLLKHKSNMCKSIFGFHLCGLQLGEIQRLRCSHDIEVARYIASIASMLTHTGHVPDGDYQRTIIELLDQCLEMSEERDDVMAYADCPACVAEVIKIGPEEATLRCFYPDRYGGRRRP